MRDWFRRLLGRSAGDERQQFFETVDALNAEVGGGAPLLTTQTLGMLRLRSGTLVLGDPGCVLDLEIPNVDASEVAVSVALRRYPSGAEQIAALQLALGEPTGGAVRQKVGEVGIDAAKLVVADKADVEEHWAETGPDRIGVILTAPDDTVLRLLTRRFGLKTVRVNPVRVEVVGPVSEELAAEIEAVLLADARYAAFPYMYFRVQTNNSFERANYLDRAWAFLPIGNRPEPRMFVCGTGRGDGRYEVWGEFEGATPRTLSVAFIED
jgi:hypothetical protein